MHSTNKLEYITVLKSSKPQNIKALTKESGAELYARVGKKYNCEVKRHDGLEDDVPDTIKSKSPCEYDSRKSAIYETGSSDYTISTTDSSDESSLDHYTPIPISGSLRCLRKAREKINTDRMLRERQDANSTSFHHFSPVINERYNRATLVNEEDGTSKPNSILEDDAYTNKRNNEEHTRFQNLSQPISKYLNGDSSLNDEAGISKSNAIFDKDVYTNKQNNREETPTVKPRRYQERLCKALENNPGHLLSFNNDPPESKTLSPEGKKTVESTRMRRKELSLNLDNALKTLDKVVKTNVSLVQNSNLSNQLKEVTQIDNVSSEISMNRSSKELTKCEEEISEKHYLASKNPNRKARSEIFSLEEEKSMHVNQVILSKTCTAALDHLNGVIKTANSTLENDALRQMETERMIQPGARKQHAKAKQEDRTKEIVPMEQPATHKDSTKAKKEDSTKFMLLPELKSDALDSVPNAEHISRYHGPKLVNSVENNLSKKTNTQVSVVRSNNDVNVHYSEESDANMDYKCWSRDRNSTKIRCKTGVEVTGGTDSDYSGTSNKANKGSKVRKYERKIQTETVKGNAGLDYRCLCPDMKRDVMEGVGELFSDAKHYIMKEAEDLYSNTKQRYISDTEDLSSNTKHRYISDTGCENTLQTIICRAHKPTPTPLQHPRAPVSKGPRYSNLKSLVDEKPESYDKGRTKSFVDEKPQSCGGSDGKLIYTDVKDELQHGVSRINKHTIVSRKSTKINGNPSIIQEQSNERARTKNWSQGSSFFFRKRSKGDNKSASNEDNSSIKFMNQLQMTSQSLPHMPSLRSTQSSGDVTKLKTQSFMCVEELPINTEDEELVTGDKKKKSAKKKISCSIRRFLHTPMKIPILTNNA